VVKEVALCQDMERTSEREQTDAGRADIEFPT